MTLAFFLTSFLCTFVNADTYLRRYQQDYEKSDPCNAPNGSFYKQNSAFNYKPYFYLQGVVDCFELEKEGKSIQNVNCGLEYGRPLPTNSSLSWVFGTQHRINNQPNAPGGANNIAFDSLGKGIATNGMMFALFNLSEPGSLRDPHWHSNSVEFSYIISGTARVTVTRYSVKRKADGRHSLEQGKGERDSETFLLQPGDGFYSPVGFHHYFQGVNESNPLFGIAAFDTHDLATFDTPQVMKNIPNDILQQVLNIDVDTLDKWYSGARRVLVDPPPGTEQTNLVNGITDNKPYLFKYSGLNKNLERQFPNVSTKAVDLNDWQALKNGDLSFAYTEILPGGLLEPYWLDNADEVIYIIEGSNLKVSRAGNGGSDQRSDMFSLCQGYTAQLEVGVTWYIKNEGKQTAKIIRFMNSNEPTMSLLYDAYYSMPEQVRFQTTYAFPGEERQ